MINWVRASWVSHFSNWFLSIYILKQMINFGAILFRLNTKCGELMSEIANQQAKVDAALDRSMEDQVGTRIKKQFLSTCLLYTSPSPRDRQKSRMPSSA